jgi:hypothetical protein
MDSLNGVSVILIGLLLRFGLPIAATILVVWLLGKIDARWQVEAEQEGIERLTQPGLVSQIRCWVLNDCPPEMRERCPAYAQLNTPCWHVFRDGNGQMKEQCLDCEVFRRAPVPIPA